MNLKVARAWAYKEDLRNLWSHLSPTWARKFFEKWYSAAIRSRLEPVKKVARMVKRKPDNVLTYCKQPFTNATAEGLNSKIMAVKRRAGGYRNAEHFETVIYFFCGGINLDPRLSRMDLLEIPEFWSSLSIIQKGGRRAPTAPRTSKNSPGISQVSDWWFKLSTRLPDIHDQNDDLSVVAMPRQGVIVDWLDRLESSDPEAIATFRSSTREEVEFGFVKAIELSRVGWI